MRVLDTLIAKPEEETTDAEAAYGETIALLIEAFEKQRYRLSRAEPAEILAELLTAHGLKQKELVDIFSFFAPKLLSPTRSTANAISRPNKFKDWLRSFTFRPLFFFCSRRPPLWSGLRRERRPSIRLLSVRASKT